MPRKSTTQYDDEVKSAPKNTGNLSQSELRQEALDGVLQLVQFGCLAFGQFADAGAIGMHGPPMTVEIVKLADTNSKVAKKVDLLLEAGPYAGIVAASIPFLAQLFVNHNVFKAEQFANAGVVEPAQLEADMKTTMMRNAMAAMQERQRVEEEMREMQEAMAKAAEWEAEDEREKAAANAE
jgi:hypothetical protein